MNFGTDSDRTSMEAILQKVGYTPEELAELVGTSAFAIRHSVRTGDLHASTIDHHILIISRRDAVDWIREQR